MKILKALAVTTLLIGVSVTAQASTETDVLERKIKEMRKDYKVLADKYSKLRKEHNQLKFKASKLQECNDKKPKLPKEELW